jgi:hypothetical protein
MWRFLSLALLAVATTGCPAHWSELKKSEREPYFVLAKDYTRTEVRGIGYKWVEGLRAGKYTAQAEDEQGLYFRGEGGCVIQLSEGKAEEYLKTGKSNSLQGGLWLPKKGVGKGPRLFYIQGGEVTREQVEAAGNSQGLPTNMAQVAGGALGGATVGAIIASGAGEVLFIGYGSETDFVAGLKIVER